LPLVRGLGIEYFVGIDGMTLVVVLAVSLLGLLAALLAQPDHRARFGASPAIQAGLSGVFISVDLGLMLAFWLLTLVAVVVALWRWAGDAALARGTALALGLGFVLVAFAVWQLSGTSTPAYLLDGAATPRVFALTELAHGGFVPRADTLFGAHPTKVVYVCLFLGAALTWRCALRGLPACLAPTSRLAARRWRDDDGAHALGASVAAILAGAQWAALWRCSAWSPRFTQRSSCSSPTSCAARGPALSASSGVVWSDARRSRPWACRAPSCSCSAAASSSR
jgi:hypothetical protein